MQNNIPLISISVLRLLVPLSILKYPFFKVVASLFIDFANLGFLNLFGIEYYDFPLYQQWDKGLDLYYFLIDFLISLRWKNTRARDVGIGLFFIRVLGVTFFLLSSNKIFFFFFPNVFEFFYIFYMGTLQFFKCDPITSSKNVFFTLLILAIPKLLQEYILHYTQWPIWQWVKTNAVLILGKRR